MECVDHGKVGGAGQRCFHDADGAVVIAGQQGVKAGIVAPATGNNANGHVLNYRYSGDMRRRQVLAGWAEQYPVRTGIPHGFGEGGALIRRGNHHHAGHRNAMLPGMVPGQQLAHYQAAHAMGDKGHRFDGFQVVQQGAQLCGVVGDGAACAGKLIV